MITENTLSSTTDSRLSAFIDGAKATIPLIIAAIPFGILYGALAITNGLSPLAAMSMSLFVFAGSAQFIAVGLIAQQVTVIVIVFTTFIVNLRHMLYGASLSPYVRSFSQRWLIPLSFWLTDESYAVVIRHCQENDDPRQLRRFFLGSTLAMYTNWQLCTLIGIVAGQRLEGLAEWGLDFAMVVTFIGIAVPLITSRPMLVCAIMSGSAGLLLNDLPNKLGLILAALIGIAAGVILENRSHVSIKKS